MLVGQPSVQSPSREAEGRRTEGDASLGYPALILCLSFGEVPMRFRSGSDEVPMRFRWK